MVFFYVDAKTFVLVCILSSLILCSFGERVVLKFWKERKPHSFQSSPVPELLFFFIFIWSNFYLQQCHFLAPCCSFLLLDQLSSLMPIPPDRLSWWEKPAGKKAAEEENSSAVYLYCTRRLSWWENLERNAAEEENPSAVCFYAHKQHQVGQFIWLLVARDPSRNQVPSQIKLYLELQPDK